MKFTEWHLIKNHRTNGFLPVAVINGRAYVLSYLVLTKGEASKICLEAMAQ